MTRLRQIALGSAAAALLMGGAVSKSFAVEAGTFQYLAGASIGIPGGAAPPPGLYTGLLSAYGLYGGMTGNQGGQLPSSTSHGVGLGAFIGAVPMVWSTGWNFLGANYTMLAVQPFVTAFAGEGNNTPVPGGVGANTDCAASIAAALNVNSLCGWHQMFLNTVWQPINLSWNWGGGWFTSVAFGFQAPDGTRTTSSPNPDYWTFIPGVAISYLSPSWNLSANMAYQIYTASGGRDALLGGTQFGIGYTNGQQFVADLHALYKMGKWQFGPVGYVEWQTTSDTGGVGGCAAIAASLVAGFGCANYNIIGVGGLVGYDFGPVDLQVWATDSVVAQNAAQAGWTIFTRLGFRIWAPEGPKPLVAKN